MSTRREPVGLSRARVCAEALALVDEEGLEALTMRRLGARLDCEAMSLYRHVKDKADLLDALHAAVLGDLQPETAVDQRTHKRQAEWRVLLGGLARALRSSLLRHPNVLPLFTTRQLSANTEYHIRVIGHTRPRRKWFLPFWDRPAAFGTAKFTFLR